MFDSTMRTVRLQPFGLTNKSVSKPVALEICSIISEKRGAQPASTAQGCLLSSVLALLIKKKKNVLQPFLCEGKQLSLKLPLRFLDTILMQSCTSWKKYENMERKALKFRMNLWFGPGYFGSAGLAIPHPSSSAFLGPGCLDGQLRNWGDKNG